MRLYTERFQWRPLESRGIKRCTQSMLRKTGWSHSAAVITTEERDSLRGILRLRESLKDDSLAKRIVLVIYIEDPKGDDTCRMITHQI